VLRYDEIAHPGSPATDSLCCELLVPDPPAARAGKSSVTTKPTRIKSGCADSSCSPGLSLSVNGEVNREVWIGPGRVLALDGSERNSVSVMAVTATSSMRDIASVENARCAVILTPCRSNACHYQCADIELYTSLMTHELTVVCRPV
jgi:hypothetical protein